jgi:Domain of unknown function (DUF5666)
LAYRYARMGVQKGIMVCGGELDLALRGAMNLKMAFGTKHVRNTVLRLAVISVSLAAGFAGASHPARAQAAPPPAQTPAAAKPVGTIKSISGNAITLTTDAGSDVTILVQDTAKLVRVAPGQKDLKDATPIQLQDLQVGDRILVVAMKQADVAQKQAHEREEWQRHGTAGLVSSVDAASNTVMISLPSIGEKKTVTIHLSNATVLRRYAPDSANIDDAKPAPLDQIKPGDQLRARGARNADGTELTADEVVSGSFRNISGTISSIDASAGTLTVQDLATKKPVTIKITPDSQLRILSPQKAQEFAMRLKGAAAGAPAQGAGGSAGTPAQASRPAGSPAGGPGASGPGGSGRPAGAGGGGLQQAILSMPPKTLADLQKADIVMIVATAGGPNGIPTAITLIGGVEPILTASPNSSASILSPWSLSGAPGGEGATP